MNAIQFWLDHGSFYTEKLTVCLSVLLYDWLIDWVNVCLPVCMTDWLTVCLTDWLTVCPSVWRTDCLSDRLSDWLTVWLPAAVRLSKWRTVWMTERTNERRKKWTSPLTNKRADKKINDWGNSSVNSDILVLIKLLESLFYLWFSGPKPWRKQHGSRREAGRAQDILPRRETSSHGDCISTE